MRTQTATKTKPLPKSAPTQLFVFPGKDELLNILSTGRPHKGKNEQELGNYIHQTTGAAPLHHPVTGEVIAYYLAIPHINPDDSNTASRVLFSAHLDTVDNTDCTHTLVEFDDATLGTDGNTVLGADDGAGVWLMLQMIKRQCPGGYVFPVGEERGGVGSKALAEHFPALLSAYDYAVAFDRAGTHSVITHQFCGRCCSDVFAGALADQLSAAANDYYMFAPDDSGVYTDTAEWTHLIPECTNLSVGYYSQHSVSETVDMRYLAAMVDICCAVEWDQLPVDRDCADTGYDNFDDSLVLSGSYAKHWGKYASYAPTLTDLEGASLSELEDWMYEYPDTMAKLMHTLING